MVQENVGEGGSAIVHKAQVTDGSNSELPPQGTYVAVKQYRKTILDIPNQLLRIEQEGTIGRDISNANVVNVYGFSLPSEEDEDCLLFMEWLEGETLDVWSKRLRSNITWEKLKEVCVNIVDGVQSLHDREILHRDIKPENVMIVSGVAKIMDVGIAEKTGDNDHTLHTTVKDFIGSVRYASPQFVLGEDFDFSDDIYSIGATLLELLSGSAPYENVERKPVLPIMVVTGPPAVGDLRDKVPAAIKILIEGCLHKDRSRRPTLTEILDVLEIGGKSPYIKKEVQHREADQRAYKIVEMDTTGGGFYADLGSDQPELEQNYTVVRKQKPIAVPSLNTEVAPEMWVATAELRHVHQSLGHFKLTKKKWVPGEASSRMALYGMTSDGHWEETDQQSLKVSIGDFVLKNKS